MENKKVVQTVYGKEYFEIDPKKTALIVVDMQNTFLAEGAWFESPVGRGLLPGINDMITFCREHKIPVVYTQTDHSYPGGGLIHQRHPCIKYEKEAWLGTESAELYPGLLQPEEGDLRVYKHKYDVFHETDLHCLLRNMDVDTIIITGVATEVCCASTARGGYSLDYKVVFASDGTGAFDPEIQAATCLIMDRMFGRSMTLKEIKDEILENL